VPHIHFPSYTNHELIQILSLTDPTPQLPSRTKEVWVRFCSAVYDSLTKHSGRDILSFRTVCTRLWPAFIQPIQDGTYTSSQFSRVLVANRSLFQNENVLIPTIVPPIPARSTTTAVVASANDKEKQNGITTQLPYYSRLLLVASYLASFNPPRNDSILFMKAASSKRRKRGGGTALSRAGTSKHRKISRKLLGPQAFVLERMLAIFHAIRIDADGRGKHNSGKGGKIEGGADIMMAIATLASLRLIVKMGPANAADMLEGGSRYRVAVGWEVVRHVARSVGVEAEDYLTD
jgi:origin recognition complex subunit 5